MLTVRLHGPEAAPEGALADRVRAALPEPGQVRVTDARPPRGAPAYAQLVTLAPAQIADLAPGAPRVARDTVLSLLLGWYADALRDTEAATRVPPPFLVLLRPLADGYSAAAAAAAHETLAAALADLRGAAIYRATGATGLPPAKALRKRLLDRWWTPYVDSGAPFRR